MSNFYCATGLIGGEAGDLDAIDAVEESLEQDDAALVVTEDMVYHYWLQDDSNVDAEDSPWVIEPTNATNQRWILVNFMAVNSNAALSSMILTGGEVSPGTNAGTIKVAALTAMLRTGTGESDPLVLCSLAEVDNITLVAADTHYFLNLTYGAPCTIASSATIGNGANVILIGHCLKDDDDEMHYSTAGLRLIDGVRKLHRRSTTLREIELCSGGVCSDGGTRNLYITAACFYRGLNNFETTLFDSTQSGVDWNYYYWNPDGSAWVKDDNGGLGHTQIDNVQYNKVDSGTGLANLGTGKYTTNWVFYMPDHDHPLVLYGRSYTLLTAAENEKIPANLPDKLVEMSALICKIIVKEGSDDLIFENLERNVFTPSITVDHNELAGLQGGSVDDYYHFTNAKHTKLTDLATTGATGAELETLTDGSETVLHSHAPVFDGAFTDLTDVDEVSIDSADIGKIVKVGDDLKLEFAEEVFGRPIILLPQSSCGPASNFATHDTIAGGSTPPEEVSVLDFDADASEYKDFKFSLPSGYAGGGLTVTVVFSMTSDNNEGSHESIVRWEVGFARIDDDGIAISADHAYAFNGVSANVPSVLTEVSYDDIAFTDGADMDSLAAGEMAILRIYRDHDHADDIATGDAELHMISIKET